jgi:pimeloyl-ACP methyl ester carboxylesterase
MRLLLMLLLAALASAGCIHRSIMPPEISARASGDVQRRLLPWRGGQLEMFEAQSPGTARFSPRAIVLEFCPGNAASVARTTAARWDERPVRVWAVNFPGYGQSTGKRKLEAIKNASLDAADTLRRVAGARAIFVQGDGISTVAAVQIATEREIQGLILRDPILTDEVKREPRSRWDAGRYASLAVWRVPSNADSIASARSTAAPAAIIADRRGLAQLQQQLDEVYQGEKRVIVQGDSERRELDDAMDWLIQRTGR